MAFWEKKEQKSEAMLQMRQFDFLKDYEAKNDLENLYQAYRQYFTDFKRDMVHVMGTTGQIDGLIDNVVEASDNVINATEYIAKGANSQSEDAAECIEVVSGFSERMGKMENLSQELIRMAYQMGQENAKSREVAGSLLEAQQKNQEVIGAITNEIYVVMEKMEKITEVTQVLTGISGQTNLLALNASIEAARAGEQGKGFAVVADQVRALSEESRTASEGIKGSVQDITRELDDLKKILDSSGAIFEQQKEAVNAVTGAMDTITNKVEEFVGQQQQFGGEVQALSAEKDRMLSAITSISAVIEEFSATTQEVASLSMTQEHIISMLIQTKKKLDKYLGQINKQADRIHTVDVSEARKKVGFLWDVDDPFWDVAAREAHKTAKVYDYDIAICAPKNRSIDEMLPFLDRMMEERFDALVISPVDDPALVKKVRQVSDAGIKIVFLQDVVANVPYEAFMGTDAKKCGEMSAVSAMDILGDKGGVVGIGIWSDVKFDAIDNRAKGFMDRLRRESRFQVVAFDVISEAQSQSQADEIIDSVLQAHPEIELIYATNSGWGLRYASYLERHPGRYKLVVVDFTADTEKYIRKGVINSAIAQRQALWGSIPLEALTDVFEGKKCDKSFRDTGTYEINKNNIEIFCR